jgi:hypothetical protein
VVLFQGGEDEVKAMDFGGNLKINSVFEASYLGEPKRPGPDADIATRERFIRAKYIDRKFYSESACLEIKAQAKEEKCVDIQQQVSASEMKCSEISPMHMQHHSSLPLILSGSPISPLHDKLVVSKAEGKLAKPILSKRDPNGPLTISTSRSEQNSKLESAAEPVDRRSNSPPDHHPVDTSDSFNEKMLNYRAQQIKLFNQAQLIKLVSPETEFAHSDTPDSIKDMLRDYRAQPIQVSPSSKSFFENDSDDDENLNQLLRNYVESPIKPASLKQTKSVVSDSLNENFREFRVKRDMIVSSEGSESPDVKTRWLRHSWPSWLTS